MNEHFEPVTTESGEHVRLEGLGILGDRFLKLRDRAKFRELTPLERAEIGWIERDLNTLQGMAPVGALRPARVPGALQLGA